MNKPEITILTILDTFLYLLDYHHELRQDISLFFFVEHLLAQTIK